MWNGQNETSIKLIQLDHQQSAVRLMDKQHGVSRIYVSAKVASCCKNFHFNFLCNPDRFSRSHKRTTSVPAAESCTPWFRINKRKPCLTERHLYMFVFDGYGIASSVRPSVCPGLVGWTVSPMILQVSTSDQHGERKMPNCFSRSEIKVQGCIVT